MREIILDTEATGLDYSCGHRLVEIGCVELIDKMRTGILYHQYLNPERDVPYEAFKIHGLSSEVLRNHPVFGEIFQDFLNFVKDSQIVIHNARFDLGFLNEELRRIGAQQLSADRVVDTLQMARSHFPCSPVNIDALCRRFGLDLSTRTRHGALIDAKLLSEIYIELSGGRQIMLNFSNLEIREESRKLEEKPHIILDQDLIQKMASNFEKRYHEEFLKRVRNPIWLNRER